MSDMQWTPEKVKVSQLKPYERNPRFMTKEQYQNLLTSMRRAGMAVLINVDPDYLVVDGHHRLKALNELGIEDVWVLVANQPLDDDTYKGLSLLLNSTETNGNFDWDMVSTDYEDTHLDYGLVVVPGYNDDKPSGKTPKDNTSEITESDLGGFSHECPKCGFQYNE